MCGIQSSISGIAVHPNPKNSTLAIAGSEGFILLWDYKKKGDPVSNYKFFSSRKEDSKEKKEKEKIFTAIEFTPDGLELLVA